MPEVIDAQVDWVAGYGNPPKLEVQLDEIPDMSEVEFEARIFENGRGLYYSDHDGYVRYFTWSGDGNDGGFSGRGYDITLTNGVEMTLRGPFSSRAGVMNKYDFGPCVDVKVTTEESVMEKGYTFSSAALSKELADEAAEMCGVSLALDPDNDEPVYRIMANYPPEWQEWSPDDNDLVARYKLKEDEDVVIHVFEDPDSNVYLKGQLRIGGEVVDTKAPNTTSKLGVAIPLMEKYAEKDYTEVLEQSW